MNFEEEKEVVGMGLVEIDRTHILHSFHYTPTFIV